MGPKPISEIDPDEWFETRRRQVLAGAGSIGAAGVGGCLQQSSETQQQEQPTPTHDHSGDHLGKSEPVDRLTVGTLSGNRRDGKTVYYDPNEPGPYPDLEAAIDDVPTGGTLQLGSAVYNVGVEGRLVLDRPMTVRGVGWSRIPNWNRRTAGQNHRGTVIQNTDRVLDSVGDERARHDPAVEAPAVEINAAPQEQSWGRHAVLRDLAVRSPTPNSEVLRVQDTIRALIADCAIHGGILTRAAAGIRYDGNSFFAQAVRNVVNGTGDYGVQVLGTGYAHEFYSNHVRCEGNDDGEAVGFETTRHRSIVVGGGYTGDVGIRFRALGSPTLGGLVVEPGFESNGIAVDIGGGPSASFDHVQLYHTKLSMAAEHVDTGVRFGNTAGSKYIYPIVWQRGDRRPIAEWTERSRNCGVISDPDTLRKVTYDDGGATSPYVRVTGSATREQLDDIPTGVPTTVDYLEDHAAPATHDGSQWRVAAMNPIE
jgi:hypothetical protein